MLNNRTLQGFLAIAPLVSLILIFVVYFAALFSIFANIETLENSSNTPTGLLTGMGMVFVVLFLTIIISLVSFIYFIVHVAKNPNLEQNNMRIVWILIIVLVGGLGNLIYWIAEIQTKKPKPIIS